MHNLYETFNATNESVEKIDGGDITSVWTADYNMKEVLYATNRLVYQNSGQFISVIAKSCPIRLLQHTG
jgi:hypothetical protein